MSLAGRILAGIFGLAGVPLAGLLVQQGLAAPGVAIALLVLYEVVILLGTIVASVAQQVVRRRVEQFMDFFDLALGRRVSRYARYYRRYVLERDGHINARDLAHTPSHIPELEAVYVDVGLAPGSPTGRAGGLLPSTRIDLAQRQSIHEFLDQERPTVCAVIGAPGSGKSTLLRHTARLAANQGKERRRRLPVMLALRDHADALTQDADTIPTLAELIRSDIGALSVAEPPGWWEAQLRNGNCLILLDGLDEVARSEHRAAIADWIDKQIAKHPKNDFVITSRPHGYQTAVIPRATVLQVRPFTTGQIRQFVFGWCRAAERHATGSSGPEIDQRANEEADDLLGQLSSAPALMELAVNPLLLTMMVMVHRERRSLPAGRADLYNQVCDVMLWRRLESKKMEVRPPGAVRQRILAALAYDMMVAETRDYPRSDVLAVFDRALQQMDTDITAEDLLTAIVESSGLLVERERDQFAFAHHTIGEYLASTHIRSKNLSSTLIRSVGDPWWRETTLLYVTDADADEIVEACLKHNTGASLALAFDCLQSHGQIHPRLRARLDSLRQEAFEQNASHEHRQLIASALASAHLSRLTTVENGALICPNPIPEDLYRLFCLITVIPAAENVRIESGPHPDRPAAGIRAAEAEAFVAWINASAALESRATYRLPTINEIQSLASRGTAGSGSGSLDAPVWSARPHSTASWSLWTPEEVNPYKVNEFDLLAAIKSDLFNTPVLMDFVIAGIRLDALALDQLLARAKASPTSSLAQNLLLPKVRAASILHDLRFIRDLYCGNGSIRNFALPENLHMELILTCAEEIEVLTSTPGGIYQSQARVERLIKSLSYASSFALDMNFSSLPAHLPIVDPDTYNGVRELVIGTTLMRILSEIRKPSGLATDFIGTDPEVRSTFFAWEFIKAVGFKSLDVDLDSLLGRIERACGSFNGAATRFRLRNSYWATTAANRLFSHAVELLAQRKSITPSLFAEIRVSALMLAGEAEAAGLDAAAADLLHFVAGVTLLERRAAGKAPLETILLARE
jgi:energy-coupling factor transporter ATP-binding protein EcfA2